MMRCGWIEVSASGFEVWCNAARGLMEVNGVLAGCEVLESEMNGNTSISLLDGGSSYGGSLGIIEDDNLGGWFISGVGSRADKCES